MKLISAGDPEAERLVGLAPYDNAKFSARAMTMKGIKKTGEKVVLPPDVRAVPAGITRVMEQQNAGYAYARP